VFVNLTWAPLQRSTRAAAEIARVQQRQTTLRKKQIQQTIWLEVRDAVRNQQSAERKLLAAARFRDLAERSLAIEQRRFVDGMTQNLAVAQRQDALAAARLAELDALLAHSRAETTLQRATGRLLAERHIEIE
jgi:outer membrane protein TolC